MQEVGCSGQMAVSGPQGGGVQGHSSHRLPMFGFRKTPPHPTLCTRAHGGGFHGKGGHVPDSRDLWVV